MTPFRFASFISSDCRSVEKVIQKSSLSRIRLKQLATVLVIAISALMLSFPNQSDAIGSLRKNGSDIFRNRCTVCHGVDGSGNTELGKKLQTPDLRSDEVQKLSDDELLEIITHGKGAMPAFKKKLSPDSIQQVIIHLRNLRKEAKKAKVYTETYTDARIAQAHGIEFNIASRSPGKICGERNK